MKNQKKKRPMEGWVKRLLEKERKRKLLAENLGLMDKMYGKDTKILGKDPRGTGYLRKKVKEPNR